PPAVSPDLDPRRARGWHGSYTAQRGRHKGEGTDEACREGERYAATHGYHHDCAEMRAVDSRTCLPRRAAHERLSILILLITRILDDRKCQALGGLDHADNRLACLQGKPSCGLHAGYWLLSRSAMPEHHHGDHIQREQTHHQQDTWMHRCSPSAMMTLPRARQHRPASSAHLPV